MVQQITTTSWGSRILGALWGMVFGLILIASAFFLIFWNEGNGLHTAQSLQQAERVLISVPSAPIDAKNNLRVIYFSGLATTNDILEDSLFKVAEKAIQLHRQVKMYQWKEEVETKTEKQLGGSEQEVKTYTYKQVWSPHLIDSATFKDPSGHNNPTMMPLKSKTQYANKVTVGDFVLPSSLVTEISGDTAVGLDKADIKALKEKFHKPVQSQGDSLYMGSDPEISKVGDMRVTITAVLPETVSVIAQQIGGTLQPYQAPGGRTVSLIEMGQVSPQQMIVDAELENRMITWLLRLVSLVMMMIGLGLLMSPLSVIADVVPFLGSLVGFGTGLLAFIGGLILWTVAVAIAWFAVRPLWAIALITLTAIISYLLYSYKKRKLTPRI